VAAATPLSADEGAYAPAVAEVVVFHHTLGLTAPVHGFADELRAAGHTVHTPDLYEGKTFETYEEGSAHSDALGGPMALVERARAEVELLPSDLFYVGFSSGVLAAQSLAQTRRARAARCSAIRRFLLASGATTGRRRGPTACGCSCTLSKATRTSRSRRGSPRPCPEQSCSPIPVVSTSSPSTTSRRRRC
jgi:hypothetical protein